MAVQPQQPLTVDQLLQMAGQGQLSSVPKLIQPQAQSYAPSGPQINFLGGATHPVNEGPAILQNGLIALMELRKAIAQMRGGGQATGLQGPALPGTEGNSGI